ncbi:nitroreductase family protein [Rubripirellula obstinata]|uniref:nitroreductase family protein n=1 Tax=Rubripirellula obstinata TaxID=406547 RepID=UPI001F3D2545|nr:nitroreductase [Rubripirellula obstinata]
MHPEHVTDLIRRRRTIKPKCFSDQSIDDAIVNQILENATWAPTHGMTQPWHFSVFVGSARQRLADFLAATYKQITTPETFKPNKYEGMSRNAMLAPVVIVVGMKRQVSEKIAELDELLAVACAVQNMHLTATAFGLGGFWSTNVAATSPAMASFVGLSAKDRALGLFYLGYPASEWPAGNRDAMDQKVQWFDQ